MLITVEQETQKRIFGTPGQSLCAQELSDTIHMYTYTFVSPYRCWTSSTVLVTKEAKVNIQSSLVVLKVDQLAFSYGGHGTKYS